MPKNRITVFLLVIFLFLIQGRAQAAPGDTTADAVLGQANFTSNAANGGGGISAAGLEWPYGMVVDPTSGRLFMSDYKNNRVLSWPDAESFTNGAAADIVLGQPNLTSNQANQGGSPDADTLYGPVGLTVDKHTGRLFVAEYLNHRVVSYAPPITTGMAADRVYGQPDFTSNTPNNGGISDHSLQYPWSVALDSTGKLYISDYGNNRVLTFFDNSTNTNAFRVYGQIGSSTNTPNNGGISASSLYSPAGINIPVTADVLTVADSNNNRVLIYDLSDGDTTADVVLGQNGSFTTNLPNKGGLGPKSLWLPTDVAFDSGHSLYVADRNNARVLRFPLNITISDTADQVFGQPNFTSNTINNGGVSANSMNFPFGLTVTPGENLLVADRSNNRVLRYDLPQPYGVPSLVNISPTEVAIGGPSFKLYVSGANFTPYSNVTWNGQIRPTTYLNSGELEATISAADVASPFTANVKVVNPGPGGGISVAQFSVTGYSAAAGDKTADRVIGQPNFDVAVANNWQVGGLGPRSIYSSYREAIDPLNGRLYIADASNNRVLSWPSAASFTNGDPADFVIGQENLYSSVDVNFDEQTASTFNLPVGVAVDNNHNVYVADELNHRVLVFLDPITTDIVADFVFGQPDFTTVTQNTGGVSANSLYQPVDVTLDSSGSLYIADHNNNRILVYFNPLTSDRTADIVIGKPDFTTVTGGPPNATNMANPRAIAIDSDDRLFVADYIFNRVLVYDTPLTNGAAADFVLGQPDFTSGSSNNGGLSAYSLNGPWGVDIDNSGNVFVSDYLNNRVLIYYRPVALNDKKADFVVGQPNFTSSEINQGGPPSENTLNSPQGLVLGLDGDLFVSDSNNHRILNYDNPLEPDFAIYLPVTIK